MTEEKPPAKKAPNRKQCPATYSRLRSSGGRNINNTVFCMKLEGHLGDHRGFRTQWNTAGTKVPITEKDPST